MGNLNNLSEINFFTCTIRVRITPTSTALKANIGYWFQTFHMNLSSVPKLQDLPTIICTLHKEIGTERLSNLLKGL